MHDLRPAERHPSRVITEQNNFLFFMLLKHTKIPVENVEQRCDCDDQACLDDWDGVTHAHILIAGDDVLIQIRTHYSEEQDQYRILDYTVITGPDGAETGVEEIIKRGEKEDELANKQKDDTYLAAVVDLFKQINN